MSVHACSLGRDVLLSVPAPADYRHGQPAPGGHGASRMQAWLSTVFADLPVRAVLAEYLVVVATYLGYGVCLFGGQRLGKGGM